MRRIRQSLLALACIAALAWTAGPIGAAQTPAAGVYPRDVVAQAKTSLNGTTIMSTLTIHIDRLIEPSRRTRVLDGLKYNGYQGFMNALRPLPVIGTIATPNRNVSARYAWETVVENHRRLIVASDKPLFFLQDEVAKPHTGYELTFVELLFDASGAARGTMSGASRVRPAAPDGIVLEDFAVEPVELTVAAPPKAKP